MVVRFCVMILLIGFHVSRASAQAELYGVLSSSAQVIGIAGDSVFKADSKRCVITYNESKSQLIVRIPLKSFVCRRGLVDHLFVSMQGDIVFTVRPEGEWWKLKSDENSARVKKFKGELEISGVTNPVEAEYQVWLTGSGMGRRSASNSNEAPLALTLNFSFDPALYGLGPDGYFVNPMEIEILQGTVNRVDF